MEPTISTMLAIIRAADINHYLNLDNPRINILDNGDDSTLEILQINLNQSLAELDAEGNIDYWEALRDIKGRIQKAIIQAFYDEYSIQRMDRGIHNN